MMAFWWRRLPAVAGVLLIFLIFLSSYGLVVALAVTLLVLATGLNAGPMNRWIDASVRALLQQMGGG